MVSANSFKLSLSKNLSLLEVIFLDFPFFSPRIFLIYRGRGKFQKLHRHIFLFTRFLLKNRIHLDPIKYL